MAERETAEAPDEPTERRPEEDRPGAARPADEASGRTAVRTLLITDLVRSTRLVEGLGDRRAAELAGRHDQLARRLLTDYRGLEIDKTDGFLLLFERPIDAVGYALAYHEALSTLSREQGVALKARSGIHLGELFLRRNPPQAVARGAKPLEVEGLAKPIAARLMSAAIGGQTLLTHGAFDLARRAAVGQTSSGGKLEWLRHGFYRFKGLDEAIEVYEVGVEGVAPLTRPPDTDKAWWVAESETGLTPVAAGEAATQPPAATRTPAGRTRTFRRAVLAALALVVAVAFGGWWLRDATRAPPGTQPPDPSAAVTMRRSAAVLGFKNLSQLPEFAWLSTGFAEMLTAELAAGQKLRMIAGQNVARAKLELSLADGETLASDTLARLRSILGADLVLLGSYLAIPEADQLHVVLNAQDTASGDTVVTLSQTGSRSGIVEIVSVLGERLRQELGIGLPSSAAAGQARASLPADPTALRQYAEGLRHLRSYDFLTARELFERAIAADPEHPLAHAALAEVWSALGYDQRASEEAGRAVELAGSLSREDQLFVAGRDHEMAARWDAAIRSFQALYDFFPDNVDYGLRLAGTLTRAGRGREALDVIASLRQLPLPASDDVRIDLAEADAAEGLADYRRSLAAAGAAARRGEAQGTRLLVAAARLSEGVAHLRLGEPGKAAATLEKARQLYASVGDLKGEAEALSRIANLVYEQGSYTEARRIYEEVLAKMRQVGNQGGIASALHNIADCRMGQGEFAAAEALFQEALAVVKELGDRQLEGLSQVNLASLALLQGRLETARSRAEEALGITREIGFAYGANAALLYLGQIQLAAAEVGDARRSFEDALAAWRDAGDPRYVAIALSYLGNLFLETGDLGAAARNLDEAREILRALPDRALRAKNQVARALVSVEEGRPAAAIEPLRQAGETFRSLAVPDDEARTAATLVAALLAAGGTEDLRPATDAAAALLPGCRSVDSRLWSEIQIARGRAALGQRREAAAALEAAAAEAGRLGFVARKLEAHLALGLIEQAAGTAGARRRLLEVRAEAEARQLLRIARKASAAGS